VRWLALNWPQVLELAWDHLLLALPSIVASVLIAVPLGRLAHRRPAVGGPLLAVAGLMYAIPALPLLIVIPAILGIALRSPATMIVALTVYGVALLVRTAADAFAAVDVRTHDGAVAIGYSPGAVFWQVDLPLAVPVLLSGVRVVAVSTISLVTIGALIGVPSLGTLLTDGFQRGIAAEVGVGVVATVALALLTDAGLLLLGRLLTPWLRPARDGRRAAASPAGQGRRG